MVNKVRTIEFLPEIFRTDANKQFLAASLDVITSQPDLKRVQGFIGRKYGYGVEPNDRYVVEPSKTRADYQLEPSVVFLKPETQIAQDFINYPGILDALKNQGGDVKNHQRLFENQFYSWDSFVNLDKLVNYSQYYWIPNGPDSVEVTATEVPLSRDYVVTDSDNGYELQGINQTNPTLTMIRGGKYSFKVNQKTQFWIQGVPGLDPVQSNINTRDVLGVTNNGATVGEVVFEVPLKTAQLQYDMPDTYFVDVVSTLTTDQIQGKKVYEIGNIDGVTQLADKTLLFYENGDQFSQLYIFQIIVDEEETIQLYPAVTLASNKKITVTSGTQYLNRSFYQEEGSKLIKIIPYLSSTLDKLYYRDGFELNSVGTINLIDSNQDRSINIADILGKKSYVSPNGVEFINGLKVFFTGTVIPSSYENNEYYVEGVGESINLIPVVEMVSLENPGQGLYNPWDVDGWETNEWDQTLFVPINSEYFTINRNSNDRNAWSRSNRWFNVQVMNATAQYNGQATTQPFNTPIRAQRPIIEFEQNLSLYNSGNIFAGFVDLFDNTTTDAFTQIVGQTVYTIDGEFLRPGQRIIFNADNNATVRQNIYQVGFASVTVGGPGVITLTPVTDVNIVNNSQTYIVSGDEFIGTAWRFSETRWIKSQTKTFQNQYPIFNIYDINGNSIGDPYYYPGTTFSGTKLFSYTPGNGADDPVLGIPISYSSGTAIGDINFTVNLNSDEFIYNVNSRPVTQNINVGFVHYYRNDTDYDRRTGWVTAVAPSIQYQVFQFDVTENKSVFVCDVPAKINTPWNNVVVYLNDNVLDSNQYTVTVDANTSTTITLNETAISGEQVTILVLSDKVSSVAYYQIPSNLENNPFNDNIAQVNVGDLKNQYQSIFNNAPGVTGQTFGINNVYNLGSLTRYGTAIIQNSASLVLPGTFLRKPDLNIFDSIKFNNDEYSNYKNTIVDITNQNDFSVYQSPADMLDTVIYQISSNKNSTNSFFWSDMMFSGSPYRVNTYSFSIDTKSANFPLGRIYDFSSANYYGLGIYLTRTVDRRVTVTQLIKGVDYKVYSDSPSVDITYDIKTGDSITIKEYNQTYASYCPNTPTKLGLYPSFIPGVILDNTYTTPTYFILGHDGSYNKLYGSYVNGQLTDLRDIVLLEFEKRIYNNLKVVGVIPLIADEVIPGQFRKTEYSREEILDIYSLTFLRWVGKNRIDYKTQLYNVANPYSYNYNQSSNKLDNTVIKQGYWRGIYEWFYDTSDPANSPWEMLGLVNKPTWWDSKYGIAPYTSDNLIMWEDISKGYVWNDGAPYVNPLKVRPDLLKVLPVNPLGTLVDPLQSVIGIYNNLTFNRPWIVGDQGPAETSYLRSSSWPFDLMRLLALTKPAKFFNLFVDRDVYKFNDTLGQYLYSDRYHLNPKNVQVYGNGTAKHSYINWVVDFINQRGLDGTDVVTTTLQNLDVRLTYNVAGFTSKDYLKFLIEKSTVNTQNTSLLIPDNSYSVLLYDNVPQERISYSSVIVQKTADGYTVWGNSQDRPYFTVSVPKPGLTNSYTVNNLTVNVNKNYYENRVTYVPYGTIFYSVQGVSEFLNSYGNYLGTQGVTFEFIDNSITYDWTQMIQEFMYWSQQYWEVGSVINLNPSSLIFTVERDGLIVQPLTLQKQNFILNQNLIPIQNQNVNIVRENEKFKVEILSQGDSVAYTNLNLASMEHTIVFDNYTVFNDTIYNLTTGLRQNRLLLQGYKSGDWNGYVDASGFILNEDNIKEWLPNVKYSKGMIVTYKSKYWIANRLIEAQAIFSEEDWTETDYDQVKNGLLPNPSTMAYESLYYYDSYVANLEQDADLLAFSLIGYRPRQYLTDADLSDITQVNVYKNIVTEKGTNLIANAFKKADLIQGQIDYDIRENWAIKNATFGSILNNNYVEVLMNQSQLTGNPTMIGFTDGLLPLAKVQQTVKLSDIINFERPPISPNFLPPYEKNYLIERGLPSAGYVNLNDAKIKTFNFTDLNDDITNLDKLYRGDALWVASYQGSWEVFTPQSLNTQLIQVINNLNGTITLEFLQPHGLVKKDPVMIFNFDLDVNGFYSVIETPTITSIVVGNNLNPTRLKINSLGLGFKLIPQRFSQPSSVQTVNNSQFYTKRAWIDRGPSGDWEVLESGPTYAPITLDVEPSQDLGTSVLYTPELGYVIGDGTTGRILRYKNNQLVQEIQVPNSNIGSVLKFAGDWLFASDPINDRVQVYEAMSTGDLILKTEVFVPNTGAIAVSSDKQWLYVADTRIREVYLYALNKTQTEYEIVNAVVGPASAVNFGETLSTGIDGVKLVVGASRESVNGLPNCGKIYVYTRGLERILATSLSTVYSISRPIPQGIADVYVDGVLIVDAVVEPTGLIRLPTAPVIGSVITVSYGTLTLVQTMTSSNEYSGGQFSKSLDTNRYGAEIVIGAPYEIATVDNVTNVEGAVHCWTNSGQKYGKVTGRVVGEQAGILYVDGYPVIFNGDITTIVRQINEQTPTNIVASNSGDILILGVIDDTVEVRNNILDVTAELPILQSLGITLYSQTQTIYDVSLESVSRFGWNVSMNERDGLLINAPVATRFNETTFDYSDDINFDNDTIFDNGATTFIDSFENNGVVYNYQYLTSDNESIDNPGKYVFGQYMNVTDTIGQALSPNFGTSLFYGSNIVMIGSPNWYQNGNGRVDAFTSNNYGSWWVDKSPLPQVDVNRLNNISIYDLVTNNNLEFLDYIDPVQGKLLGALETNIDYVGSVDPAQYNNGVEWTEKYIGRTWLDTTNLRILNYNQPDITYNASNWGVAFPGSTADIFTWVESSVPPIQYVGPGFVTQVDNYTSVQTLDDSTNSITTLYYFWVKNYSQVPPGKTLSPVTMSQYVLNPQTSGIGFLAGITLNTVALFNCGDFIQANTSVLHLGYGSGDGKDQGHELWTLIQSGEASSFLTGVPKSGEEPYSLYLKFLDSFAGEDQQGRVVPDPRLPVLVRSGVSFRPRQSMFNNRLLALENYIQYANQILSKFTITESRSLYFLNQIGPGYDTREYWNYEDWWAPGYGPDTKIILEVETVSDLQTLVPNQVIPGTQNLAITLEDGLVVRVAKNRYGDSEVWVWFQATDWQRIGLENGTIKISDGLWTESLGWDGQAYDTNLWGDSLANETYWIIRWLNEEVYIDDLEIERNNSLMLMFNLIQSETLENQNYLDWLNKTSLIDVSHRVRDLIPYKKFQRDNQEFLEGYLNEIKPYHVKIKDFSFKYDGIDEYPGNITDFDLPAQYNSNTGKFDTPMLDYKDTEFEPNQYLPDSPIWKEQEYNQWFENYGLSISSSELGLFIVTKVSKYISKEDKVIFLNDVNGIPESGIVVIGQEQISYNSLDPINNTLLGVDRGVNSIVSDHLPGESVRISVPDIIVLDQGRAYTAPPTIKAVIDTALYPVPRVEAILEPIMASDKMIGVKVLNPGSGYAVTPKIEISSSVTAQFVSSNINLVFNQITIENHPFLTGDSVVYSHTDGTPVGGLQDGEYYYVRKLDDNTIALYNSYSGAFDIEKYGLSDKSRISLTSLGSTTTKNTLGVTARVTCFTNSQPIRELKTALKFDRTSYGSLVTDWTGGDFYAGVLEDTTKIASSSLSSNTSWPWDNTKWDVEGWSGELLASSQGAVLSISNNPYSIQADIDGNVFVDLDYSTTIVAPGQLNGQQLYFYKDENIIKPGTDLWDSPEWAWDIQEWDGTNSLIWANLNKYYAKVINAQRVALYYDPLFNYPVKISAFKYVAGDPVMLPEPFYFDRSLVKYAGKLWRCVVSNNDSEFDYNKWEQILSDNNILNAADRTIAFYQPRSNMSGLDLRQLMTGIEYPNDIIEGRTFDYGSNWDATNWDTTPWGNNPDGEYDTNLISPAFNYDTINNPTVYDVQGGQFTDGYGPEELIPGLVTDQLNFTVITSTDPVFAEETNPPAPETFLNFRISVSKYGKGEVYNINPYTQTKLTSDFISTGNIDDIMYVEDVTKLVIKKEITVTTDSTGYVLVPGIVPFLITYLEISLPNKFTWQSELNNNISMNIEGITQPTEVTVTVAEGNQMLINGEFIGFTSVNFVNNSVTGLQRGRNGTITNDFIANNTTVQSVLDRDKLPQVYYDQWWYGRGGWSFQPWSTIPGWSYPSSYFGGTLYESQWPPAVFLKKTEP